MPNAKLAVIAPRALKWGQELMTSEVEDLEWLSEALAEIEANRRKKQLIDENPYVLHLLQVLVPKGASGMRRQDVIDAVMERRRGAGLPIPKKPDETIQSALQQYCIHSKVFKASGAPASRGLFLWPKGPRAGIWAADPQRAMD
jgi:hypothetical protein